MLAPRLGAKGATFTAASQSIPLLATLFASSEETHVFEIGKSLRNAREQQKLELSDIERATRIRGKYLRALEEDRFAVLPGTAYVKGFLRTYAGYLGLDGQRFLDEYNAQFPADEDARRSRHACALRARSTSTWPGCRGPCWTA